MQIENIVKSNTMSFNFYSFNSIEFDAPKPANIKNVDKLITRQTNKLTKRQLRERTLEFDVRAMHVFKWCVDRTGRARTARHIACWILMIFSVESVTNIHGTNTAFFQLLCCLSNICFLLFRCRSKVWKATIYLFKFFSVEMNENSWKFLRKSHDSTDGAQTCGKIKSAEKSRSDLPK